MSYRCRTTVQKESRRQPKGEKGERAASADQRASRGNQHSTRGVRSRERLLFRSRSPLGRVCAALSVGMASAAMAAGPLAMSGLDLAAAVEPMPNILGLTVHEPFLFGVGDLPAGSFESVLRSVGLQGVHDEPLNGLTIPVSHVIHMELNY